jgi:phosphatidylinositol alpha-1,6-mannosyltransferase
LVKVKLVIVALGIYSRVGGIERYLQRVVRCLSDATDQEPDQVEVISLWDRPADEPPGLGRLRYYPCNSSKVRALLTFFRTVHRLKPDAILYGHVLLAPLAGAARLLSVRSRHLMLAYGVEVWGDRPERGVPWWEGFVIRHWMDRVLAISRYTADRMRAWYGLPGGMCSILACAVDSGATSRPERTTAPKETVPRRRLLTVSRLVDRYKGWHNVIRALPAVLREFPDVEYVIVGDGPLREELKMLAEHSGVGQNVRFSGWLGEEELAKAYGQSDVFVMPSSGEGFGIVFLEAWLHGLPVIAGNRDAATDLVTPFVDGVLVDPDSPTEIASAVLRLLRDPEAAQRMGLNGYRRAVKEYSHSRFCGELRDLLQA